MKGNYQEKYDKLPLDKNDILKLRQDGKTWGEISKILKIDIKRLNTWKNYHKETLIDLGII